METIRGCWSVKELERQIASLVNIQAITDCTVRELSYHDVVE